MSKIGMHTDLGDEPEWSEKKQVPVLVRKAPSWWHPGGYRLSIDSMSNYHLKLSSDRVHANIGIQGRGCAIQWLIKTTESKDAREGYLAGRLMFDKQTFYSAFFGEDLVHCTAIPMISLHGGDAGRLGCFIRYQEYLNIPGPGCGQDGDPNISLFLDEEIKDAIARIIAAEQMSKY